MLTISRLPDDMPVDTARAFEEVAREILGATGERLEVHFGIWRADDGRRQFVCRVEGPPADAFALEPQWRWWSLLLDGPDDLRVALRAAVDRRFGRSHVVRPRPAPPAAAGSF